MVLCTLILTGGDLRMFLDVRAAIVIFGGSFATTLIRFPLSSIFHGLPLGAKFAFSLRRMSQRDLVDDWPGSRKSRGSQAQSVSFMAVAVDPLRCRGRQPAVPIVADKLQLKLVDEEINRTLTIDEILMIREGKSPTLVREMLLAYLPEKHREEGNGD